MQHTLPAGWRMTNSSGSWSAPAHPDEDEEDIADREGLQPEDLRPDSPGWEDVEEDTGDEIKVQSLFCEKQFKSFDEFDVHEKEVFGFDLRSVARKAGGM
jgi:hypothetical protein